MTESELQNKIFLTYGRLPYCTLWRNNVGVAREDVSREHLERLAGMLRMGAADEALSLLMALLREKPRFTRYGLGTGSSDIVGIIEPACGGHAVFLALELKSPRGVVPKEQQQWLDIVNRRGGVARVVRTVEQAGEAIAKARAL